jgi:hypothetical protein
MGEGPTSHFLSKSKTNTHLAGRHQIDTRWDYFLPLPAKRYPRHNAQTDDNFICQGRHWKHPNFVYSRWMNRCASLPRASLSCKIVSRTSDPSHTGRVYINWNLRASKEGHLYMPTPFQPGKAWNPSLIPTFNLNLTPILSSTLLTPHNTGHTLISGEAYNSLHCFYVGDLRMEDGHWQHMQDVSTQCYTITNIRRLAANLEAAKTFFAITTQITTRSLLVLSSKH